jgi:hypothetical protein
MIRGWTVAGGESGARKDVSEFNGKEARSSLASVGSALLFVQVNSRSKTSSSISCRSSIIWLNLEAKLVLNEVVFLSDGARVRLKSPIINQGSLMVLATLLKSLRN